MNSENIAQLVEQMAANDISELEVRIVGGPHLYLRRSPGAKCPGRKPAAEPAYIHRITAPAIGIFLHRHPGSGLGAVKAGMDIGTGEIAGFIRTDHRLTAVRAVQGGTVRLLLAPDGALVGYGTELLELQV